MINNKTEQDYLWDTLDELFPNTTSDIYPFSEEESSLDKELKEKETYMIIDALTACNYNQTHTAKMLNVGRTNLIARCKRLGISLSSPELDETPLFHN
tara:strand:- start:440 stop:733 length:294 start_codon:yes stop_codon:yes gene_type:complete